MSAIDPTPSIDLDSEPLLGEKDVDTETPLRINSELSLEKWRLVGFQLERQQLCRIVRLHVEQAHGRKRHRWPSQHF